MHVRMGDNGWPGIFIPGDEAMFNADAVEMMALDIDGPPYVRKWLLEYAKSLRTCYVKERADNGA